MTADRARNLNSEPTAEPAQPEANAARADAKGGPAAARPGSPGSAPSAAEPSAPTPAHPAADAARASDAAAPAPSLRARVLAIATTRPDPLSGFVLTLPVFLFYHLGVLRVPQHVGADLISGLALYALDESPWSYAIAVFAFVLALAAVVWVRQKRGSVPRWAIGRVLLESAAFALVSAFTLGWAIHRFSHGGALPPGSDVSVFTKLVLACGSGFHEELVFRALLISGGTAALINLFAMKRPSALLTSVLASSLAFAVAQYLGPFGDAFAFDTFMYRALLGLAFAALYLVRGFALVVYTHVFFTALVLFAYA